jgi:hypothetical protein
VAHNKVKQNTIIEKKSKKKEEKTQDKQQRGRQAGQRNKIKCPQTYLSPLNTK